MSDPVRAGDAPIPVEVEAGKAYFWCTCGRSSGQPFCDGSHKGTDFTPVAYTATRDQIVFFCGCKQSSRAAVCDGSHTRVTAADAD